MLPIVLCALSLAAKPQAPKPPQAPPMTVKQAPSCKKPDCDCGCNDGGTCKCILVKKVTKSCHCSDLCTCGCNEGQSCRCDSKAMSITPTIMYQVAPVTYTTPAVQYTQQPMQSMHQMPMQYHQPAYRPQMMNFAPAMSFGGGGGC